MRKKLMMAAAMIALAAPLFAQNGNGQTGNLAPSGPHYDLNLIGVDQAKKPPLNNGNRHTIFVPLVSSNVDGVDTDPLPGHDIWLQPAQPGQNLFNVCDGNAFDTAYDCYGNPIIPPGFSAQNPAQGASFQLPCNNLITAATGTTLVPCSGNNVSANYSVWVRVTGTPSGPGGGGTITTCAYDFTIPNSPQPVCSTNNSGLLVKTKSNKFVNVTNALTSLVANSKTTALFEEPYQFFFWDYDNNGNKVLQLRFYLED
jgi:hypothetical protein